MDGDSSRPARSRRCNLRARRLRQLGLMSEPTLMAYEDLFHRGDATAFPVLMQARHAA